MASPRYLSGIQVLLFDASDSVQPRNGRVTYYIKSFDDLTYETQGNIFIGEVDMSKPCNQIVDEAIRQICEMEGIPIPGMSSLTVWG